jgi:hypothetical protein
MKAAPGLGRENDQNDRPGCISRSSICSEKKKRRNVAPLRQV